MKVTEEILEFLIEDEEYLAVFFSGPCEEDDPCDDILEELVIYVTNAQPRLFIDL